MWAVLLACAAAEGPDPGLFRCGPLAGASSNALCVLFEAVDSFGLLKWQFAAFSLWAVLSALVVALYALDLDIEIQVTLVDRVPEDVPATFEKSTMTSTATEPPDIEPPG